MNKQLIQRCIDELTYLSNDGDNSVLLSELKAELEKPEQEPGHRG